MTKPLLKIEGLKTWFDTEQGTLHAVDGVDLEIHPGETFALLGESGCGKSMLALSMMQLVPAPAGRVVGGAVLLGSNDLLQMSEVQMRSIRGGRLSMIFQEPQSSLNPVLTIGEQIRETLVRHTKLKGNGARLRVLELLDAVGIPDPARRYKEYPHQLSGGMKQRVVIAIALAASPELLIADEPTTALDVTIQAQVLQLLCDLQQETGMSILLITHDLGVVAEMADRVAVMYAGQIVELARREAFFSAPQHPYSRKLFDSLPSTGKRNQRLAVLPGSVPALNQTFSGCRFVDRCDNAWNACHDHVPTWITETTERGVRCHLYDNRYSVPAPTVAKFQPEVSKPLRVAGDRTLLDVRNLCIHFPIQRGLLKRVVGHVRAVDGVSLVLRNGHTLALVGESGCGKTTVGKGILQLLRLTSGSIRFQDTELTRLKGEALRRCRTDLQIIFQDPYSSMNPRMMVGSIIEEGMSALGVGVSGVERSRRVVSLLEKVGLSTEASSRYPHEFSGGQRQRICIARALAVDPKLIVCDEPTSALDVSVQAQILNLLQDLQIDLGLSYLFITHNLSVVEYLAHEVAVMYLGRIVEQGMVDEVLSRAHHPYTQALLSAVPVVHQTTKTHVIRLEGDIPSATQPPEGCHFHPRCPHAMPVCRERYPTVVSLSDTHTTRCHLLEMRTK